MPIKYSYSCEMKCLCFVAHVGLQPIDSLSYGSMVILANTSGESFQPVLFKQLDLCMKSQQVYIQVTGMRLYDKYDILGV